MNIQSFMVLYSDPKKRTYDFYKPEIKMAIEFLNRNNKEQKIKLFESAVGSAIEAVNPAQRSRLEQKVRELTHDPEADLTLFFNRDLLNFHKHNGPLYLIALKPMEE